MLLLCISLTFILQIIKVYFNNNVILHNNNKNYNKFNKCMIIQNKNKVKINKINKFNKKTMNKTITMNKNKKIRKNKLEKIVMIN